MKPHAQAMIYWGIYQLFTALAHNQIQLNKALYDGSFWIVLHCFSHLYWQQILRKQQEPEQQWQHISPCWPVRSITGNLPAWYSETQPGSQSSSAISGVTSPFKLVGKIRRGSGVNFSQQMMANPKWRHQAKNATSAKILEEMKKNVGNRFGFFNQRLPSNAKSCWRIFFQGIVPRVRCY